MLSPTLKSIHVDLILLPCSQIFLLRLFLPPSRRLDLDGPRLFMGRGPPVLPPHLRSLDPSTLIYLEGWSILPVGCWAYRTAFASESSRCRGLEREIFGSRVSTVRCHPPCRFGLAPRWGGNLPPSVGGSGPAYVDFSNAAKLRNVDFLPGTPTVA